jgi:hypothetical protein
VAAGLGAISLAGAWPALAARAPRPWNRAALAAIGWVWTAVAGLLARGGLYTRLPERLPDVWAAAFVPTVHHVVLRVLTPGLMAPAAVWALAAWVLPWITSRSLAVQVVLVSAWAGALASGTHTALRVFHAGVPPRSGVVALGAVGAALAALGPALFTWHRRALVSGNSEPGLA